jgi:hypothetical protein
MECKKDLLVKFTKRSFGCALYGNRIRAKCLEGTHSTTKLTELRLFRADV